MFQVFHSIGFLPKNHNTFHKSVHGIIYLCTTGCEIMKIVRNVPLLASNGTIWNLDLYNLKNLKKINGINLEIYKNLEKHFSQK